MSALPSLRQLSYLVTLAETLHFTEAAKRSFVTQSTLSGGIIELERVLGGALVERSRQTVRLTPLGIIQINNINSSLPKCLSGSKKAAKCTI
jgi:LysR family hydrogen peroxide-inducible transcriptional activator